VHRGFRQPRKPLEAKRTRPLTHSAPGAGRNLPTTAWFAHRLLGTRAGLGRHRGGSTWPAVIITVPTSPVEATRSTAISHVFWARDLPVATDETGRSRTPVGSVHRIVVARTRLIASPRTPCTVALMTTNKAVNEHPNDSACRHLGAPDETDEAGGKSEEHADGTLRVVVHDGEGSWFTVPNLVVSALTAAEYDELEAGSESVLSGLPILALREVLSEDFTSSDLSFD
jgi:hypothetical protein